MKRTSSALAALCAAIVFAGASAADAGKVEAPKEPQKNNQAFKEQDQAPRYARSVSKRDERTSYRIIKLDNAPTNGVQAHVCGDNYAIKTTKGVRLTTGPARLEGRSYVRRENYRYEQRSWGQRNDWIPVNENEERSEQTRRPARG